MMTPGWPLQKLAASSANGAERTAGFTLVEVMIGLLILSVGLLGLASQTLSVIKANVLSDQITKATILAEDKLEELKRLGYAHAQLSDGGDTTDVSTDIKSYPALFTNPDHSDQNYNGETGTVALKLLEKCPRPGPPAPPSDPLHPYCPNLVWNVANNTPATGMKTVTVIVGWHTLNPKGADPARHYVALTTIIHEYQ